MTVALVRYGVIPEVARFESGAVNGLERGSSVVIETHRGLQLGTFLERVKPTHPADRVDPQVEPSPPRPLLRVGTDADISTASGLRREAESAFAEWTAHIVDWNLELELIDLEWTLDRDKLILYVLNERGPDCTKLALQAAAAGLGIVEVQPVNAEGLVTLQTEGGGGCGSCGCH